MKNILSTASLLLLMITNLSAQSVVGTWKTIDDNTGEAKSYVEIFEKDGKIYGKILEIFNKELINAICTECEGADKDKPLHGLEIIKGLEKDGDEYNDGKILDPETGSLYKCYIKLEEVNKLKVRGYMGFALIGRTQYWIRAE